jgi:RND superfamily putative drug exporter
MPPSAPSTERAAGERRPGARTGLGRALRRLRWPVVILWVLATVLLHPLASQLSSVTNDSSSANLPPSARSTQVALLQRGAQKHAGGVDQTVAVFVRPGGLTPEDLTAVADARAAVASLPGSAGSPGAVIRSADGEAAGFIAPARYVTDVTAIRKAVATAARPTAKGLQTAVTGPAAVRADRGGHTSQTTLLLTALVIVIAILLIVYRSPVLWLLPIVSALGAITVAQAAAHGLADGGLTVSTLSASILIVLVFGAASDYALLLIHRYREELRRHPAAEDAMAAALRATLPTLTASAATVTGAMLCLLAAESASLHGLGPVGAVSIIAALLAQTTFLPALLLVCGRGALWPRAPRPGTAGREESRVWAAIGARVARRPAAVATVGVLLLVAACFGLTLLRTDSNPVDNIGPGSQSAVGARLVTEHLGAGVLDPLVLLAPPSEGSTAASIARALPTVAGVSAAKQPLGGYDQYSVTLKVDPYGSQAGSAISDLRRELDLRAPGSLLGGNPAISYDVSRAASRDTKVLMPLVLVIILLVVALLLRAVVAPVLLVATTALSFAASFGLSTLLWRYGLGYRGIVAELPLYIFIFLVALGVDYNIFLTARIREETRVLDTARATVRGLSVTGGVITAAGAVLAGTFLALVQNPQVDIAEVGSAVAIGVLLDTLLVRTVVVPATFLLTGEATWWPARRAAAPRADEPGPEGAAVPTAGAATGQI